jgi:hypothetical protein
MKLSALAEEYLAVRSPGWLVLDDDQVADCMLSAARFYAGYGDIRSLSASDVLQGAAGAGEPLPAPQDPELFPSPALPIKDLTLITPDTELSVGEWVLIRPLFALYCEREHAQRLEASRGLGVDVYGRSVSEISQEISTMETETLPQKAFVHAVIEVF